MTPNASGLWRSKKFVHATITSTGNTKYMQALAVRYIVRVKNHREKQIYRRLGGLLKRISENDECTSSRDAKLAKTPLWVAILKF
mmetsp:Transcript_6606/g.10418  ORF Transcript_6606/g.10418 Transcript_6606/m.10418 type:complete len:85 (+) Transcript_6606:71-325(+)